MKLRLFSILIIIVGLHPVSVFGECTSGDCQKGFGVFNFKDGREYSGEWHEGKITGFGTLEYPDGTTLEGDFVNGQLEGQGTKQLPNGTVSKGEFHNNLFIKNSDNFDYLGVSQEEIRNLLQEYAEKNYLEALLTNDNLGAIKEIWVQHKINNKKEAIKIAENHLLRLNDYKIKPPPKKIVMKGLTPEEARRIEAYYQKEARKEMSDARKESDQAYLYLLKQKAMYKQPVQQTRNLGGTSSDEYKNTIRPSDTWARDSCRANCDSGFKLCLSSPTIDNCGDRLGWCKKNCPK